jgi:hypothetical protein
MAFITTNRFIIAGVLVSINIAFAVTEILNLIVRG